MNEEQHLLGLLRDKQQKAKAFELLVAQYSEPLYWKIRSIVILHDDADDVLQNTFLKAWRCLDTFRGDSTISTWLHRIAINESLDFLRRQRREQSLNAQHASTLTNQLISDPYFEGDKAQALLQEAIATLPDVQRTVFTLRYYDEMPYHQMSQLLSTSEGALKASYHIAVKKVTDYVLSHTSLS